MNLFLYFWLFLKASLFSTGGQGNLPSLHADLIPRHWATQREFAESLAVGQVSPGPNGLWVISLGYLTAGVPGSLLALVAITLPPFVVLAVERLYARIQHHPAVEGFVRGLSLAVVGAFIAVMDSLLHGPGVSRESALIVTAAIAIAATKRVPVIVILGLGAVTGILTR